MKKLLILLLLPLQLIAQNTPKSIFFWSALEQHCGKSYEGAIIEGGKEGDGFLGEKLVIQLKHDHRHKDGSEDDITQYGGKSSNTGLKDIQFFPADQETSNLIPYASNNVWWVTIDATSFTYNLRRIGTDRLFSVKFDLTKAIETPSAPWGSED